jgi:hypothetical protein
MMRAFFEEKARLSGARGGKSPLSKKSVKCGRSHNIIG